MTNAEKFTEVFGNEDEIPNRKYATKDWWVQEYIEPKTKWIPVSERLPEEGQIVLITQSYGWKEFEEGTEVTIAQYRRKHFTWYRYQRDWDKHTSIMTHGDICPGNEYVNAWMPLPDPWKGESE